MSDPVTLKTIEAIVASYGLPGLLVFWMVWQHTRTPARSDPSSQLLSAVTDTQINVKIILAQNEALEKRLKRVEEWQDRKDSVQHFTDRTIPPR